MIMIITPKKMTFGYMFGSQCSFILSSSWCKIFLVSCIFCNVTMWHMVCSSMFMNCSFYAHFHCNVSVACNYSAQLKSICSRVVGKGSTWSHCKRSIQWKKSKCSMLCSLDRFHLDQLVSSDHRDTQQNTYDGMWMHESNLTRRLKKGKQQKWRHACCEMVIACL